MSLGSWIVVGVAWFGLIGCGQATATLDLSPVIKLVKKFHQVTPFNGNLWISQGDTVLLHRQYGLSNRQFKIATQARTQYLSQPLTQPWVAAALLRQVEHNRLQLNQPLVDFAPSYLNQAWLAQITLADLLCHRCLFPGSKSPMPLDSDPWQSLISVQAQPLPKQEEAIYHPLNLQLLCAIIESATGEAWWQGLANADLPTLFLPAKLRPTQLQGHSAFRDLVDLDKVIPDSRCGPRMVFRLPEWHAWYQALLGGKLLTASSLIELFRPRPGRYAYAGEVITRPNGPALIVLTDSNYGQDLKIIYQPQHDLLLMLAGHHLPPSLLGTTTQFVSTLAESILVEIACQLPS